MTTERLAITRRIVAVYRPVFAARTWLITAYLLASVVIRTFWFGVLWILTGIGLGLAAVYVGLLILAALPAIWRIGAKGERALVSLVFDVRIPSPYRKPLGGTRLRKARVAVTDPATWKDLAYLVLLFPLGTLWCVVVTVVWGLSLGLAALPLYFYALPNQAATWIAFDATDLSVGTWWKVSLACLAGLLLTGPAAWTVRGVGYLHRTVAQYLLGSTPTQALAAEALRFKEGRDRAVEAAEAERRRIERDLHDGAQQRLTALVMDLAIAKSKFKTDPASAETLVDRAHQGAKLAIKELRDLARGLHPAMLAERGLDAALSALAGRSPVPVDIDVDLVPRPDPEVENALYFVISEALANTAKHAHATRAWVAVQRDAVRDRVRASIRDDGIGGAVMSAGGGLAGLEIRSAAVGGTLNVSSPPGGPTVITAEVPCES